MRSKLMVAALAALVGCGSSEAGPDAAVPDAPLPDAGRACADDGDCNNGFFCDGEETCGEAGVCVPGLAPTCDDAVACTTDVCSDELRECVYVPRDADGDGRADATCLDGAGAPLGDDCDDGDANRFPGNVELCDEAGHDEDCDLETYGRVDDDGDGYDAARCCNGATCGTDCDDLREATRPGINEVCDGLDNNCDGNVDEEVAAQVYADLDGDGFGAGDPLAACAGTPRTSALATDCDDADVSRHPSQLEVCDGKDNNCDVGGLIDEDATAVPWYPDLDGDGFGDPLGDVIIACIPPADHALRATDCDDAVAAISPIAAEVCDGRDNDCNGLADFVIGVNDLEDDDGDGLVDGECVGGTDCDDADAATGPAEVEQCDGRDNDCDAIVDEGADEVLWYADLDEDGFGSVVSGTVISCQPPAGYVAGGGDCDDADAARAPGVFEGCDELDNDCDGAIDEGAVDQLWYLDGDLDGFGSATAGTLVACVQPDGYVAAGGDCADADETRYPGQVEACDAIDNNCEAGVDESPASEGCPAAAGAVPTCSAGACVLACLPGFVDCDGLYATGCEVSLEDDATNCGACGQVCDFRGTGNLTGACVAGACECAGNFADCNDDTADGCEIDLTSNAGNCGACGNFCSADNAISACAGGSCDLALCFPGWDSCDADPANGCETQVNTLTECGFCGNDCTLLPNVDAAACGGDGCRIEQCAPDRDDCDDDPNNGCEAALLTSPQNCGSCGRTCNAPNQDDTCTNGACGCLPGFEDCDGNPSNGCETNLDTDPNRCGSCATSCFVAGQNGMAQCNTGSCEVQCAPGWGECGDDPDPLTCDTPLSSMTDCGACDQTCTPGDSNSTPSCQPQGQTSSCRFQCDQGFADCDTFADTCETSTSDDPANCGGCGLTCGAAGSCSNGQCDRVIKLAIGAEFTCAVRAGGGVACWGDDTFGQLGQGAGDQTSHVPVTVPLPDLATDIAAGVSHVCALTTGGVYCWGRNQFGQVGNFSSGNNQEAPVFVDNLQGFVRLALGQEHTCALTNDGEVWCWGSDSQGQLGDGSGGGFATSPQGPVSIPGIYAYHLAAGMNHTCAVGQSDTYCWGSNMFGQLGNNSFVNSASPVAVIGDGGAQLIQAGDDHTCQVRQIVGPLLECWGRDHRLQLGNDASPTDSPFPVSASFTDTRQLSLQAENVYVLNGLGQVYAWGADSFGQLGRITTGPDTGFPLLVSTLSGVQGLANPGTMSRHMCAVEHDGEVWCWGRNASGQVGIGETTAFTGQPQKVPL